MLFARFLVKPSSNCLLARAQIADNENVHPGNIFRSHPFQQGFHTKSNVFKLTLKSLWWPSRILTLRRWSSPGFLLAFSFQQLSLGVFPSGWVASSCEASWYPMQPNDSLLGWQQKVRKPIIGGFSNDLISLSVCDFRLVHSCLPWLQYHLLTGLTVINWNLFWPTYQVWYALFGSSECLQLHGETPFAGEDARSWGKVSNGWTWDE